MPTGNATILPRDYALGNAFTVTVVRRGLTCVSQRRVLDASRTKASLDSIRAVVVARQSTYHLVPQGVSWAF